MLKASGRSASDAVTATMSVDDKSVRFPTKADVGYGITTDGTASFDPKCIYANNGNGRGWEWRYLPFYLAEPATVVVRLAGSVENTYHQWLSISNLSLLYSATDPSGIKSTLSPEENEAVYDLSGLRVKKAQKGVFIKGTKKVAF